MRIVVITSCTGEKSVEVDNALTLEDFEKGEDHVRAREAELSNFLTRAETLYTGQQHVRLMRGVEAFRSQDSNEPTLDLEILSAGYGLVNSENLLAPYEATFQGMRARQLRKWADTLKIPHAVRSSLADPYDLALILLGDGYLSACNFDDSLVLGGPTLLFCGSRMAAKLPEIPNLHVTPLTNREAKRFSCGLIALKGQLAARILTKLSGKSAPSFIDSIADTNADALTLLEEGNSTLPKRKRGQAKPNPNVNFTIEIPESWRQKSKKASLSYFIPEWDDLVDPDYDFATDTHSGGSGDWSNEVYAHQMYKEPNYDGLLVSKVVAEKSKKKKERINEMGVHRFLRVPRDLPIMGDCGAFGYIADDVPPYETGEILDYYTRLDFDYGVSIDHLITKNSEQVRNARYQLTIQNAEDFLKEHGAQHLNWTPIGAVQGWDAKSYAEAAQAYVKMGYKYIALGGLVRSTTKNVLQILDAVHQVVPESVAIHLFGLARIQAMDRFASLGVRSVDSASLLRRAWMGTGQNYLSFDGTFFSAIRVPEANKSFRAKRMVSEGRADASAVERLEKACMRALNAYDLGELSLDLVLNTLRDYDHLITPDRPDTSDFYRQTLEAAPWKSCPCEICRKDGIQVVIFRGNNRNRRRGFHNTFVFYRLLQRALAGEQIAFKKPHDKAPQLHLFGSNKGVPDAV
jgi:hypothetical protein